jgi:hypothetical protein
VILYGIYLSVFNVIESGKKNGRCCGEKKRIMGRPSTILARLGVPTAFVPGIIPFLQKM